MPARIGFRLLKVGHCAHPECMALRGGRFGSVAFPALCGLLEHPTRGPVLFDTGYSERFLAATAPFPERLYRWITPPTLAPEESLLHQLHGLGIAARDVRHVLVSHFHGDHVAGLKDFPHARFTVMRAEHDALRARSRIGNLVKGVLPALLPSDFDARVAFAEDCASVALPSSLQPFAGGFDLFGDGSVLAVPLPGHARGQMGIVFRGRDDRLVFMVADACWSQRALREDRPPAWLATRVFDHVGAYRRTFASLHRLAASADAPLLVPSHCGQTWNEVRNAVG